MTNRKIKIEKTFIETNRKTSDAKILDIYRKRNIKMVKDLRKLFKRSIVTVLADLVENFEKKAIY